MRSRGTNGDRGQRRIHGMFKMSTGGGGGVNGEGREGYEDGECHLGTTTVPGYYYVAPAALPTYFRISTSYWYHPSDQNT